MQFEKPDRDGKVSLNAFELRLAGWRPVATCCDRDQMLYNAGRRAASSDQRVRLWQLGAVALFLLATSSGGIALVERSRRHSLEVSLAHLATIKIDQLAGTTNTQKIQEHRSGPAFAPQSYFVLTAGLGRNLSENWPVDYSPGPITTSPNVDSQKRSSENAPVQARDLEQFISL